MAGARRYFRAALSASGLLVIILMIVFADHLSNHDPTAGMNLRSRFVPPALMEGGSWEHPMGTDNLGRDIFVRVLYGGRVSLRVALIASTLSSVLGIAVGLMSGYLRGWIDRLMLRLTDMWVSFPFLVLALAVIAAVGSTPTVLITLLTLAGWVYPARVTRAQTLRLRELDYVRASVAIGAAPLAIMWRHILPNVLPVNLVLWTLSVGTLVVIEGSLSFIGLGVSPPTPSWGNMLADGRIYMQDAWWLSVFPGAALMLTVLCINALGDALQKLGENGR
ncbi:MAG: ABC transporter permease [Anaerolineae bacterium]|nr:ABC transporter permease [Anaerolineae bacterium]